MKCLKEGRQPTPGPPGGDPSMQPQPSSSSQNQDLSQQLPPPPPQMPSAPPADPFTQQSLVRDAGSAPLPYLQPSGQASHFVYDAPSAPSTLPPPSTELDQQSTFTLPPPKNASSPAASHPPPSYSSTSATTTVSSRKNAALDSLSASSPAPISFSKTSNTTSAAAHSNEEEHEIDPFSIDHTAVVDAQKEARHAISALQYDDVKTAVAKLRNALALLEPLTKK